MILLCIQPATELLNHNLYKRYPRVIYAAHVHLWLGRSLLIAGAIQGGLGFLFAAEFKKAVVEQWPRVGYAVVAGIMWTFYIVVGIVYPEVKDSIRSRRSEKRRTRVVSAQQVEDLRADSTVWSQAGFQRV